MVMPMFIETIRKEHAPNTPIFTKDILSLFPKYTKAYTFRLLKQAINEGKLIYYSRGVYCLPKKNLFGNSSLTPSTVANSKYISDGKSVFGVYSGLALLNYFSLSSQVPNVLEIVTNNEATRKRTIEIDGMKFIVRKSRFEITNNNYKYYTILQLFLDAGVNAKFSNFSKQQISEYIEKENINKNVLVKYAMMFPAQALKNLVASEVLYGSL